MQRWLPNRPAAVHLRAVQVRPVAAHAKPVAKGKPATEPVATPVARLAAEPEPPARHLWAVGWHGA